jgi:DNA-binding HxlR family transcriptional regulator
MNGRAALNDPGLPEPSSEGAGCSPPSIGMLLNLLSAGAGGSILMALGEGPLRTKELVERVPHYAARTVYRYAERLVQLGLVEREQVPGVPSVVTYSLAPGAGTDLFTLLTSQARTWLVPQSSGHIAAQSWASLGMLADLWELGIVDELSRGGRSVTQLAKGSHELTFHQIARRTNRFLAAGLLEKQPGDGPSKLFTLTHKARQGLGLVAAVARWRHCHLDSDAEAGLSRAETATVLRATLPLAHMPGLEGMRFALCVEGPEDVVAETDGEVVGVAVGGDSTAVADPEAVPVAEAWARAQAGHWIDAVVDGRSDLVSMGGMPELVGTFLDRLHGGLWAAPR